MAGTVSATSMAMFGSRAFFILIRAESATSGASIQYYACLSQHRAARDHEFDQRAGMDIRQPQLRAEFPGTLFMPPIPTPTLSGCSSAILFVDSLAIVAHGNHYGLFTLSQRY